eukprot:CAMPEP_0183392610 /NCGR_PEP_ID=MMETSP0370-20130417/7300_1 /TAXON_ID=268820 /ORGANISM="Peridinium aciculiferum, Strain PAER-2" /LENGTH=301 /DNA_ID=CAMNT_0025572595 /DNA_START=65 /DNA_END=966 /DNA_ORIENTATION=+
MPRAKRTCIRLALLVLAASLSRAFLGRTVAAFITLPKARPPVLVLPGFGNAAEDYGEGELISTGEVVADGGLVGRLQRRGFESVEVLPVARADWLRILGGLWDEDFRAGSAPPDTAFGWYLDRVDESVKQATSRTGQRVMLLAHSAGGWLGRAALGRRSAALSENVRAVVSLGSPHRRPEADDQTRGALKFVDDNYPGAFLKSRGVEYVTVAGSAVLGDEAASQGTPERQAWVSYERLVGRGDVPGDGIVPCDNAHLDGATQITLPNVRHSIGTPKSWYGADAVIDEWLPQVTFALARQDL